MIAFVHCIAMIIFVVLQVLLEQRIILQIQNNGKTLTSDLIHQQFVGQKVWKPDKTWGEGTVDDDLHTNKER